MRRLGLLFSILILAGASFAEPNNVIYVDIDASGGANDGSSWENAFLDIQRGINAARTAGGLEVWVAEGTYKQAIVMMSGVHLYGGFSGGEALRSERDTIQHRTILDAETNAHAFSGVRDARLDGLVISRVDPYDKTSAAEQGGGLACAFSSFAIVDCEFSNLSGGGAAAIDMTDSSSLVVVDCKFLDNYGYSGAVTVAANCSLTVRDSVFFKNTAYYGYGEGGGAIKTSGSLDLLCCVFLENDGEAGGAIHVKNGTALIKGSEFWRNLAHFSTGAEGGAVFVDRGDATVADSVFVENEAGGYWDGGGALVCQYSNSFNYGNVSLHGCAFFGNGSGGGLAGAVYIGSADNVVENCLFASNESAALYISKATEIVNCTFDGNTLGSPGGSGLSLNESPSTVRNCIIWDNAMTGGSAANISYCDIEGGYPGIGHQDANPSFASGPAGTAQTITYDSDAFLTEITDSLASLTPSAMAGKVVRVGSLDQHYYVIKNNTTTSISVWGDATEGGSVSAPQVYEVLDFHLSASSPCVDTGTDSGAPSLDLDGNTRPWGAATDIGAYEYASSPPANVAPDTPSNNSPPDGATNASLTPIVSCSGFSDPDAGDTHVGSHWQIRETTNPGDYSVNTFDSVETHVDIESIRVPPGLLSYATSYAWRVRHRDNHAAWSQWSSETLFTVAAESQVTAVPAVPRNAEPADGRTVSTLTPILQSSAYNDPTAATTHLASQWQVREVTSPPDYSAPVYDSGVSFGDLTSLLIPGGLLQYNTAYAWRVRYMASNGKWGPWSRETIFVVEPGSGLAVIFVDADATNGANNGSSWQNAYIDLTLAVTAASGPGAEVWVAEGTYLEFITLTDGVHLYGGFAGGETLRSQRDWDLHPTIIDGSTANDGSPAPHVVVCGGANATLDGFTITGAAGGSPAGGGVYGSIASLRVSNCLLTENSASTGSGVYSADTSSVEILNCRFLRNLGSSAVYSDTNSVLTVSNSVFFENTGSGSGGGVYAHSTVRIVQCVFMGNDATYGGAVNVSGGTGLIARSVFADNLTHYSTGCGGGSISSSGTINIQQCVFVGNETEYGSGGAISVSGNLSLCDSVFVANRAPGTTSSGYGGAIRITSDNNRIWNCIFTQNYARTSGAVIYSSYVNDLIEIANCTLDSNFNSAGFSGIDCAYDPHASASIRNSIIWASGVLEFSGGEVTYCDVEGGYDGVGNIDSEPSFDSGRAGTAQTLTYDSDNLLTTLFDPFADLVPGALAGEVVQIGAVSPEFFVVQDNAATSLVVWGDAARSVPTIYVVLEYGLASSSPCIDTGTEQGAPTVDFDGNVRTLDGGVDIGAYEYGAAPPSPNAPATPSNVTPSEGETGVPRSPTLQGTAFSDPDPGNTHLASHWQIRASNRPSDYSVLAFDSGKTTTFLESIEVPPGRLVYNYSYYWRVRYLDHYGTWSEWSAESQFFTQGAPGNVPDQPTNISPSNGATDVSLTPTLTSSAFSDRDAGDTHEASRWQVRESLSSSDYSTTVFDSGTDATNLTSLAISPSTLAGNTSYSWRVRYQDSAGAWSAWSVETAFTTIEHDSPVITTNNGQDFTTSEPNLTLEGTCDAATNEIRVNDSTSGVTYTPGATTWSYTCILVEGANTFSVVAVDAVSSISSPATVTITLDTAALNPPVITTNGGNDYATNQSALALEGTCSSDTAELRVNGSTSGVDYAPGATTWSYSVTLAEGDNHFSVVAYDAGEHPSVADMIAVTLDKTLPIISLLGNDEETIGVGEEYVDAGATGWDNYDGDLTESIVTVNPVNTSEAGDYMVSYNVSDSAGNQAKEVTRPVHVIESGITPPEIELQPDAPTTLDDLVCLVTVPSTTLPGRMTLYEYTWTNGTATLVSGPKRALLDALDATLTMKGDTWTCTVRCLDGVGESDPVEAQTVIVNSLPEPPVLSFPSQESDRKNLYCIVVEPSYDADGDECTYAFEWWYIVAGETTAVEFRSDWVNYDDAFTSWIDRSFTEERDKWYCIVTPNDGTSDGTSATTDECQITAIGDTPSSISCSVEPASIQLGQSVTISGMIEAVNFWGTFVSFNSTMPSGEERGNHPQAVPVPGNSNDYSKVFYPHAASEDEAPWELTASWIGDNVYAGAESDPVSFEVTKAPTSLSLELSASSVPMNFARLTATAKLTAPLPDELSSLLTGIEVNLYVKLPDGSAPNGMPLVAKTNAQGVATFTPLHFTDAGVTFSTAGTWKCVVEFEEDRNFLQSTSLGESGWLTVKDRAGYAVLVLGRLDEDGEGLPEHAKTLDFVYSAFRERGFADEDIYYLRGGLEQPSPYIVVDDTEPTEEDVQRAIETWAADKMNATSAPLYVVLVDHGKRGSFFVYSGSYGESREITSAELGRSFDRLQDNLDGEAQDEKIVLVYGACHSGSFIPTVSGEHRVIITSTTEDEVSHRGVIDPDDLIRDGEVFVTEFFRNAREGKNLKRSFEIATAQTWEYTATDTSAGRSSWGQHPLLDDNGDGLGTGEWLSTQPGEDGSLAHELVLGYGFNVGDSTGWLTVTPTVSLGPDDPVPLLEAKVTQSPAIGLTAWIEVKAPSYWGASIVDEDNPDSQHVVEMVSLPSDNTDPVDGIFRWSDFGDTFDMSGTYKVFYYVKDGATDETSTYMLTTIYRLKEETNPPESVALVYPDDGAEVYSTTFFAWQEAPNPDGDAFSYRLELAEDQDFTAGLIVKEGILGTVVHPREIDDIVDGQTYYWRVVSVDEYGAASQDDSVRTFSVNNANPAVPGAVIGVITDADTGAPIEGAIITVTPGPATCTSSSQGIYLVVGLDGGKQYTVRVFIPESQIESDAQVQIPAGGLVEANFQLEVAAAAGDPDVNGDNGVNAVDVQLVINEALGINTGYNCNIDGAGNVNAVDVQLVINAALGIDISGSF